MSSILSFLGVTDASSGGSDVVQRIAAELDRLEPDAARFVAAVAFVLSRIAAADHDVTDDETRTMQRLVEERAGLPADQAALVVTMARTEQRLFGATDDFLVTRELARVSSYDQKLHLVDCLFAVATTDGRIRAEESDEISRIARELRVEPSDLARVRSQYRDLLSVRQGLGGSST